MSEHRRRTQHIPKRNLPSAAPQTSSRSSRNPRIQTNNPRDQLAHTSTDLDPHSSTHTYTAAPSTYTNEQSSIGINQWNPQATTQRVNINNTYVGDSTYTAEAWQFVPSAGAVVSEGVYCPSLSPSFQDRVAPSGNSSFPPSIQITTDSNPSALRTQIQDRSLSHFRPQQNLLVPFSMAYEAQSQDMQVPVSPISHHTASRGASPLAESGRKRSFSQVDPERNEHSPQESNPSLTSPIYMDDGRPAPRMTRTVKRPEPPTNENHKYICNVSADCASLTFERKCEWSKHMDKHDRPYRCPHPQCAKLQGFTYSGGLLRHEREVHNKHGGPRAFLMCPHPTCKRHTEKGFTRRENLHEHLRRVHAGKDDPSQSQDTTAMELDTPGSALTSAGDEDIYNALDTKRRPEEQRNTFHEVDDLKEQLQRLRAENEAKSAIIHRLEEDARLQNERLANLERALHQLQPAVV